MSDQNLVLFAEDSDPEYAVEIDLIEAGEPIVDDDVAADVIAAADHVVDVAELTESLEAFTGRFLELVSAESWSPAVTQQYQIGVSSIFKSVGSNLDMSLLEVSTESSDQKLSIGQRAKALLKRMWEVFKGALGAFIDKLVKLVAAYGKTRRAVEKMYKKLEQSFADSKGNPARDRFTGSPRWASYLMMNGNPLSAAKSLDTTIDLFKTFASDWVSMYSKTTSMVSKSAMNGGTYEAGDAAVLNKEQDFGPGIWPGGVEITVVGEQDNVKPTLLTAKVHVTRTAVSVKDPLVLQRSEVQAVINGLSTLEVAMRNIESSMLDAIRRLKKIQGEKASEKVKVGPRLTSKLISKIAAGPRVAVPLAGGIAQQAFIHASRSIATYR